MQTLHDWGGKRPSEFGLCEPEEDLSLMAGYTVAASQMKAWEQTVQEIELEKAKRK